MYLFQWGGRGTTDWRSLKSMAGPSMYLFAEDNENKVTIKPIEMPHFRIEKKGIFVKCLQEEYCTSIC